MPVIRSGPCGVPATPLGDLGDTAEGNREGSSALQLGFRGFAAGYHPEVQTFLTRHGTLLGGLTRVADPETLLSCVSDMRPDYLVLGQPSGPEDIVWHIQAASRSAQLAVLVPGCDDERSEAQTHGLILEPIATNADGAEVALVLRALMRRTRPQAMVGQSAWGDLVLDEACLTFSVRGHPVSLSLEVFGVLGLMMDDPGRVWARSELHRFVFGAGSRNDIRAIDTRISRARRHVSSGLGRDPIRTVRGVGYALVPDP